LLIATGCCLAYSSHQANTAASPTHLFRGCCLQAKAVAKESPAFVHSLNGLPLVLMSEGGSASEVWKSIELGAAEYLEKPLSTLKLRNIWQHVVRKVVLIQQQHCGCWHAKHSTQLPFRSMLILYVLTKLWHCLQMMHGCEQEDSSCKLSGRDSAHASSSFLQQVCSLDDGSTTLSGSGCSQQQQLYYVTQFVAQKSLFCLKCFVVSKRACSSCPVWFVLLWLTCVYVYRSPPLNLARQARLQPSALA